MTTRRADPPAFIPRPRLENTKQYILFPLRYEGNEPVFKYYIGEPLDVAREMLVNLFEGYSEFIEPRGIYGILFFYDLFQKYIGTYTLNGTDEELLRFRRMGQFQMVYGREILTLEKELPAGFTLESSKFYGKSVSKFPEDLQSTWSKLKSIIKLYPGDLSQYLEDVSLASELLMSDQNNFEQSVKVKDMKRMVSELGLEDLQYLIQTTRISQNCDEYYWSPVVHELGDHNFEG